MDPAYYVAAGSLKARSFAMDVVANNLANVSTHGYKPDRIFYTLFNKAKGAGIPKQLNDGTIIGNRGTNFDQGALTASGRPLDLALQGPGFLVVRTPQGELLTRDGRLKMGLNGQIQAMDGLPLLGKGSQPVTLDPAAGEVTISLDGTIQQGANVVGQLDIREVANPLGLKKVGSSRFDATNAQAQATSSATTVAQGYLEQSGVDMPSTMVEMLKINRLFEMSMKVASAVSNDLDARSINDVGGLR